MRRLRKSSAPGRRWTVASLVLIVLGLSFAVFRDQLADLIDGSQSDGGRSVSGQRTIKADRKPKLPAVEPVPGAPVTGSPSPAPEDSTDVDVQPIPIGKPNRGRRLPPMTPQERALGQAVLARDANLAEILDGENYTIVEAVAWGRQARRNDPPPREIKLGVAFILALDNKVTRREAWQFIVYNPRRSRAPYKIVKRRSTVRDLTHLLVTVDLHRKRVAGISAHPAPGAVR
jgi:hypothetical protein